MKYIVSRRKLELIYHFVMLFILTGAFTSLLHLKSGYVDFDASSGDPVMQVLLIVGYLLMVPYIVQNAKHILNSFRLNFWLWALVLLAFVSIIWSDAQSVTLRKSVALFLTMLYGLILVIRFSFHEYFKLLGNVLFTTMALSLFAIILFPQFGIMHEFSLQGNWSGIFSHKNTLGLICVLGLIVFTYLFMKSRGKHRLFIIFEISLSTVLLIGSHSTTSQIVAFTLFVGFIFFVVISRLRWTIPIWLLVVFFLAILIIPWVLTNYAQVLGFLGKDITLTGRVPIWEASIHEGIKKIWLGYGYKAFWLGNNGPSFWVIQGIGKNPGHGHNGYLDLFLELGIVGVIGCVLVLLSSVIQITKGIRLSKGRNPEYLILLLLFVFLVSYNFVESHLVTPNQITGIFLIQVGYLGMHNIKTVTFRNKVPTQTNLSPKNIVREID